MDGALFCPLRQRHSLRLRLHRRSRARRARRTAEGLDARRCLRPRRPCCARERIRSKSGSARPFATGGDHVLGQSRWCSGCVLRCAAPSRRDQQLPRGPRLRLARSMGSRPMGELASWHRARSELDCHPHAARRLAHSPARAGEPASVRGAWEARSAPDARSGGQARHRLQPRAVRRARHLLLWLLRG